MKSLWAQYHQETEGHEVVEGKCGFVRYSFNDELKLCLVHDLFVQKEFRRDRIAWDLADTVTQIARNRGCTHLWSRCGVGTGGVNEALQANLAYGFKVQAAEGGFIIMLKDISKAEASWVKKAE